MSTSETRRHLPPVLVEAIELRVVEMPLRDPFASSHSSLARRPLLLVRALTSDGEGWGECPALPEPTYTSEYLAGAHQVMREHLVGRLVAKRVDPSGVQAALSEVKGHRMAKSALEMAVLDASLKLEGASLAEWMGSSRGAVPAGVAVGLQVSLTALVEQVEAFVAEGYRRVKLKIKPGWDAKPLTALRERFGPGLPLQVDANGAYDLGDAKRLRALDRFGLVLVEQPLAEDDLEGHAALARQMETPLCLDEALDSVVAARRALDMGACSVVNLKPARVGGYLEALRVHDLCLERGVGLWCGGMFESGLGRAANLALASLEGFNLVGDLSASGRYWRRDLTPPFELKGGFLEVPRAPGIGVEPDPEALEALTVSAQLCR